MTPLLGTLCLFVAHVFLNLYYYVYNVDSLIGSLFPALFNYDF